MLTKKVSSKFFLILFILHTFVFSNILIAAENAGKIDGKFSITHTGGTNYNIPIVVPPGLNGMQPNLALNYSSQQGNGFLGLGWDISGISAISRCPATKFRDGLFGAISYSSADRFCFSGQRLISVSGNDGDDNTEYRFESDNQSKVVSYGNCNDSVSHCYFKLWTRDGQVLEFGSTENARIKSEGFEKTRVWTLNRVADHNKNYMTIHYFKNKGTYYPETIEYALNDSNPQLKTHKVRFISEPRNDIEINLNGGLHQSLNRLTHIQTYTDSVLVKNYQLEYKTSPYTYKSTLTAMAECYGLDNVTCLPKTVFEYGNKSPGMSEDFSEGYGHQEVKVAWNGISSWMVDLNKDGLVDNLTMRDGSNHWDFHVLLNQDGRLEPSGNVWGKSAERTGAGGRAMWIIDMNGDGYPDVLYRDSKKSAKLHLLLNNKGESFGEDVVIAELPSKLLADGKEWPVDINADGLMDYVYLSDLDGKNSTVVAIINKDGGTHFVSNYFGSANVSKNDLTWLVDMNADNRVDIITRDGSEIKVNHQNSEYGNIYFSQTVLWNPQLEIKDQLNPGSSEWFMDFNSDGVTDYVYMSKDKGSDGKRIIKAAYGTIIGDATSDFPVTIARTGSLQLSELGSAVPSSNAQRSQWWGDFNGDGLGDFAYNDGKDFILLLNENGRKLTDSQWNVTRGGVLAWSGETQWVTDFDGNGLADYFYLENGSKIVRGLLSNGSKPDMLEVIRDGLGLEKTISYQSIIDAKYPTFYKVGNQTYPLLDVTSPVYAVSGYTEYDFITNNKYQRYYQYEAAVVDTLGRGWLGFKSRTEIDSVNQVREDLVFNQTFPLTGTLASENLSNNLNQSPLAFTTHQYIYQESNGVYSVDKISSTTKHFSPDETVPNHTTGITYQYDSFDNVTVIEDLGDINRSGDEIFYCQEYINDEASWHIGLVKSSKSLTESRCGNYQGWESSSDQSWQHNVYDQHYNVIESCEWLNDRVDSENIENDESQLEASTCPNTQGGQWRRIEYSYDTFGNPTKVIDPLGNVTLIEYDQNYHTYPVSTTFPNGFLLKKQYDAKFGVEVSSTDHNGVTSRSEYDGFGRLKATFGPESNNLNKEIQLSSVEYSLGEYGLGMNLTTYTRTHWNESDDATQWSWNKKVIDTNGRTISSLNKAADGNIRTVDYQYDHLGRKVSETQPYYLGEPTHTSMAKYDQFSNPVKVINSVGIERNFSYRLSYWNGQAVTEQVQTFASPTGEGVESLIQRKDIRGNIVSIEFPDGSSSSSFYDIFGRNIKSIDERGLATEQVFDSLGRMISRTDPDTGTTLMFHNLEGHLVKQIDANGYFRSYVYDNLGRVERKTSGKSGWFDTLTPSIETVSYSYDDETVNFGRGRLTAIDMPNVDASYRFGYDAYGNTADKIISFKGKEYVFSHQFDVVGREVSSQLPDGSIVYSQFDDGLNLAGVSLVDNARSDLTISARYERYNASGQPQTVVYGNEFQVTRHYDELGRLAHSVAEREHELLLDNVYHWNDANKLRMIEDKFESSHTQNFEFDAIGQLSNAVGSYGNKQYRYDLNGNLVEKDGRQLTYSNNSNHLITANDGSQIYSHDLHGNITSKIAFNIVGGYKNDNYKYDANNRLTSVVRKSANNWLEAFVPNVRVIGEYLYDYKGQRIFKRGADGTETFYISEHYEVTRPSGSDLELHTKSLIGPTGLVASVTQDSNEITLRSAAIYNNDHWQGQLKNWFADLTSAEGQIKSGYHIKQASMVSFLVLMALLALFSFVKRSYVLTNSWRRFLLHLNSKRFLSRKSVKRLSWNLVTDEPHRIFSALAPMVMAVFLIANVTPSYADLSPGRFGAGVPDISTQYFYQDHRFSTSLVMNNANSEVTRIKYSPFGAIDEQNSSGTDNFRNKFTGKEADTDTGLYYFGARYLDPSIGQFITADPKRQFSSSYLYAANDPLTFIDPTGESAAVIIGIGVVVGLAYAYFSTALATKKLRPSHWDWTSGSTYGSLALGFVSGFIAGASLGASSGAAFGALQVAKQVGTAAATQAAASAVIVATVELAIEVAFVLSVAYDIKWLENVTFAASIGLFVLDIAKFARKYLPKRAIETPQFSNKGSFDMSFVSSTERRTKRVNYGTFVDLNESPSRSLSFSSVSSESDAFSNIDSLAHLENKTGATDKTAVIAGLTASIAVGLISIDSPPLTQSAVDAELSISTGGYSNNHVDDLILTHPIQAVQHYNSIKEHLSQLQ